MEVMSVLGSRSIYYCSGTVAVLTGMILLRPYVRRRRTVRPYVRRRRTNVSMVLVP